MIKIEKRIVYEKVKKAKDSRELLKLNEQIAKQLKGKKNETNTN